ncbi:MAG: twin-arginine translocase TatA/TatE family subunit [Candidatus Thermoplasmatota archaeon]|nr:twin-arginine translocase TatA/TatE family subunit [Candidatus Thermoplasmatota archaeon]
MSFIGWPELVLVLVILIFIFGAKRIKGLAKGLGEGVREFKNATTDSSDDSDDSEDVNKNIIEMARKQGITTEGKKITQILKEIDDLKTEKS